jgi:hypothetical protein
MEWGLGGGEWGQRVFLGGMEQGDRENSILFTANSEKVTKNWKFSPNSKKHKIDQN